MAKPTFPQFLLLPVELRLLIWELALDEDINTPEIYYYQPTDFLDWNQLPHGEGMLHSRVTTGFPALLHACAEARSIARSRLDYTADRARHEAAVPVPEPVPVLVPFRTYRPERDTMFVDSSQALEMLLHTFGVSTNADDSPCAQIRHLAMPLACLYHGYENLSYWLARMAALGRISLVFGQRPRPPAGSPATAAAAAVRLRCALDDWTEQAEAEPGWTQFKAVDVRNALRDFEYFLGTIEAEVEGVAQWDEGSGPSHIALDAKRLVRRPLLRYSAGGDGSEGSATTAAAAAAASSTQGGG